MAQSVFAKEKRQKQLQEKLSQQPYMTDGELASFFNVSVPTIRLDRLTLGIPELRERLKQLAESDHDSGEANGCEGVLIDIEKKVKGISIMETTKEMCFHNSDTVKSSCIFAMTEALASAIMEMPIAITQVGNIKYKLPVTCGTKLVARGQVKQIRKNSVILWVKVYDKEAEVYSGKFIFHAGHK